MLHSGSWPWSGRSAETRLIPMWPLWGVGGRLLEFILRTWVGDGLYPSRTLWVEVNEWTGERQVTSLAASSDGDWHTHRKQSVWSFTSLVRLRGHLSLVIGCTGVVDNTFYSSWCDMHVLGRGWIGCWRWCVWSQLYNPIVLWGICQNRFLELLLKMRMCLMSTLYNQMYYTWYDGYCLFSGEGEVILWDWAAKGSTGSDYPSSSLTFLLKY